MHSATTLVTLLGLAAIAPAAGGAAWIPSHVADETVQIEAATEDDNNTDLDVDLEELLAERGVEQENENGNGGVEKRFAGGWCTMHLKYKSKDTGKKKTSTVTMTVYDADGFTMGSRAINKDGYTVRVAGRVKKSMPKSVRFEANLGTAKFRYGKEKWNSDETAHCKVGKIDNHESFWGTSRSTQTDMDCGFTC
ncbi:hypothetical protein PG994_007936 [Apiospora phragmitis]|uniref:Uncharacterized protein n=1 Tax=Apiospora phragmitis TaxID=2905665 RepID=A0ABR1URL9_9PEZI